MKDKKNFYIPKISLIGRSGVGKSTFFNRLTYKKNALVGIHSNITRDRQYNFFWIEEKKFILIDTGGINNKKETINKYVVEQAKISIEECNLVLFIVDIKYGITSIDFMIAEYLRSCKKIVLLVGNKIDDVNSHKNISDFYELGLDNFYIISAMHGHGIKNLLKKIYFLLKNFHCVSKNKTLNNFEKITPIKIAIVGCPNSGKSTLVNTIIGEKRVIVYDEPGTTRDSVYIPIEKNKKKYIIIDTAGIRKRKKIHHIIEKNSKKEALKSIEDSDVAILVIDGRKGISDQDLCLINVILKMGRSLVLAFNKYDTLSKDIKINMKKQINFRLHFLNFIRIHFISALYKIGINCLFKSIREAYQVSTRIINTSALMRIMIKATKEHQPPIINGRRIKIKYAHFGGHKPFTIVLHGNQLKHLPQSYTCYLSNFFRKELNVIGTSIQIQYKENKNPYT